MSCNEKPKTGHRRRISIAAANGGSNMKASAVMACLQLSENES
jgi:hypothetical protein